MLRRVDNISLVLAPHFLSSKGHLRLHIGKSVADFSKLRLTKEEFYQFWANQRTKPFRFAVNNKVYWLFEDRFYIDTDHLSASDVKALLVARRKTQRAQIERAKSIAATNINPTQMKRVAIPDAIKMAVWQRDNGRCQRCGSNYELQFDHIIPISLGGANTLENLQILCGKCNRAKSNSII